MARASYSNSQASQSSWSGSNDGGMSKYGMGLPFYRQAALYACLGTPIAVATQYELVADAAEQIRPVHEELVGLAAQGELAHFHDTAATSPRPDSKGRRQMDTKT